MSAAIAEPPNMDTKDGDEGGHPKMSWWFTVDSDRFNAHYGFMIIKTSMTSGVAENIKSPLQFRFGAPKPDLTKGMLMESIRLWAPLESWAPTMLGCTLRH
ncbi:hypothetical protein TNCV_3744621 [Trichonephila clavipes]|nr:hypothetical protein TNCV_3744621 [Trichonephila clavipes]